MTNRHGFIEKLAEFAASGKQFVCVTMVDSHGSVPQEVGSKMLVDASGLLFGTVGGGRIEQHAISVAQEMLSLPANSNSNQLHEWNLKRDIGMTCGGSVKLFFETVNHRVWSIVIFGAGHVAGSLVRCLLTLDCKVTVIDSRPDWLEKMPSDSKLECKCIPEPVEFVSQIPNYAFVLLMTMGHRTDRPILEEILKSQKQLSYLGVIGSQGKRGALRKELLASGIAPELVDSFRCPIGLPIGSNEPSEIAISVVAELLQVRDELRKTASAKDSVSEATAGAGRLEALDR